MVRNDLVNYGHRYTPEEYATSPEMTIGLDVQEKTLAHVPLADHAAAIAGRVQHVAQRLLARVEADRHFGGRGIFLLAVAVAVVHQVVADHVVQAIAQRMPARSECCPREGVQAGHVT